MDLGCETSVVFKMCIFCRCCCLHFVAVATACMHFATAAWIKMFELYVFSESLFVVNSRLNGMLDGNLCNLTLDENLCDMLDGSIRLFI